MKLCWLDISALDDSLKAAVTEEAIHAGVQAIVSDDPADLTSLPPSIRKVLLPRHADLPSWPTDADVVIIDPELHGTTPARLAAEHPELEFGRFVEIVDAPTLEKACQSAREDAWSVLLFRDPTKIPLEIVLAAANSAAGQIITMVADADEAEIVFGVLERGSEGVMMPARTVGDATALTKVAGPAPADLDLVELDVTRTTHVGMGERACVDTTSYLAKDEGILVGSHSKGMILCVSETHPLPYMPTRPFRVNAGAIHSYTLSGDGRTNYLSELRSGGKVMAVDVKGRCRLVTVGRIKIESRPLLQIEAVAPDGTEVNIILQDDWHVRLLGPGGAVLNSTAIRKGDKLLGYLPTQDRHVGYPIDEFCLEQ